MPAAYKEQITKTFRDDAIRSVLLIDDEYNPYSELSQRQEDLIKNVQETVSSLEEEGQHSGVPDDPEEAKKKLRVIYQQLDNLRKSSTEVTEGFKRTSVAADFVNFFHDEMYICDVEKQVNRLNPDKVRKSDLIILDYCLSGADASQSLQLLRSLSISKHLNLVVIYTDKPLDQVWLEIAATLRSPKNLTPQFYFSDDAKSLADWGNAEEEYNESWTNLSREQQVRYICGKQDEVVNEVLTQFWSDIQSHNDFDESIHQKPTEAIAHYLSELDVRKKNLIGDGGIISHVHGEDELWIQCGEVFIALCEKNGESPEELKQQPKVVWDKLEEALHNWYPNFYRVALSELQNRIEDSNFSMSKELGRPKHEQIALLWSILKESPENQLNVSEGLLRHLLRDISDEILNRDNKSASEFIKTTALSSVESPLEYIKLTSKTRVEHNNFVKHAVELAKANYKSNDEQFNTEFCLKIAHAYNERTTTLLEIPPYITTGMVLKSTKSNRERWFMCVTASCDTVPEQKSADNAAQLAPHRLLTFAKLDVVELADALANAHQSSYIFISDGDKRIALSVINEVSKQPDLVKLIIVNHNDRVLSKGGQKALKLKNKGDNVKTEELNMIPIVLLDSAYAARYQAVQSHHEGRIGVDFTTADFSEPEIIDEVIGLTD